MHGFIIRMVDTGFDIWEVKSFFPFIKPIFFRISRSILTAKTNLLLLLSRRISWCTWHCCLLYVFGLNFITFFYLFRFRISLFLTNYFIWISLKLVLIIFSFPFGWLLFPFIFITIFFSVILSTFHLFCFFIWICYFLFLDNWFLNLFILISSLVLLNFTYWLIFRWFFKFNIILFLFIFILWSNCLLLYCFFFWLTLLLYIIVFILIIVFFFFFYLFIFLAFSHESSHWVCTNLRFRITFNLLFNRSVFNRWVFFHLIDLLNLFFFFIFNFLLNRLLNSLLWLYWYLLIRRWLDNLRLWPINSNLIEVSIKIIEQCLVFH